MKKITVLPNLITTANVFCGFLAIIKITRGLSENNPDFLLHGAWYIFLAMVFDALDGKVARIVKVASDFGSQLDSLCDAVSFGIAPAFLVYVLQAQFADQILDTVYKERFLFMTSAIFVCCAILRLARFNVEVGLEQKDHRYFKGAPTPAVAGGLASLVVLFFNEDVALFFTKEQVQHGVLFILPWYTLICSLLMVSSARFVHIVSVFTASKVRFEILVCFVIVVVMFYVNPELSIFASFQLYLLAGLLNWPRKPKPL